MSLIKIAISMKQIRVEKYLRNKYKPHVADAYMRAVKDKSLAKGAVGIIKQTLGKNGIKELKEKLK